MPGKRKLKIVIDTNIWVSFLIGKNLSSLKSLITNQNIRIIISDELIEEIEEVTSRPKLRKYFPIPSKNIAKPQTVVRHSKKLKKLRKKKLTGQKEFEKNILKVNSRTIIKKMEAYTLAEIEDKHIGKKGTKERDEYEYELKMELLGRMIKVTRKEQNLTQEELGKLIGVNKSQISKLENHANSATIETILKVFNALKAEINFNVKLEDNYIQLA